MLAEVENKKRRNTRTLTVNGETFVLVPASEYRALTRRASASDAQLPPKPKPQANGNYDAIAAMRAIIARSQRVRDRPAGLTLIFCRASGGVITPRYIYVRIWLVVLPCICPAKTQIQLPGAYYAPSNP